MKKVRFTGAPLGVLTLAAACGSAATPAKTVKRWGRMLYAIGGNPEAARLAGIPVERLRVLA